MRLFRWIEKKYRQRNYKFIYSEAHGYGVANRISPRHTKLWFVNHNDIIEDGEYNQA